MHIPSAPTSELSILPFSQALEQALRENPDYDVNRWLYVPPFYGDYRYILGTRGKRPLICIGINPSTAAPEHLDNTLKSVQRIAAFNRYDSFIMFNVYAQRATNPKDMEEEFNPVLHRENLEAFRYVLKQSGNSPALWAAWGTVLEKRRYLPKLVKDFADAARPYGARWFSCGRVSKKGHPHHPLYLRSDTPVEPFDVNRYLEGLS